MVNEQFFSSGIQLGKRGKCFFFEFKNTNTRLIGLSILFIFIICYCCALRYCTWNCNVYVIPIKIIFLPSPPICLYHLYENRVFEPLLSWCLVVTACYAVEIRQHCWKQCHCEGFLVLKQCIMGKETLSNIFVCRATAKGKWQIYFWWFHILDFLTMNRSMKHKF